MRHVIDRVTKTAAVFALVLSFPALVLGQAPARSFLITAGQGIGAVQIGMTIAQVRAMLGHEAGTAADPSAGVSILTWKTAGVGRLGVWFTGGKAVNVAINRDPRYATAQGLRDGDSADKVRSVMGAPPDVASLPSVTLGRLDVLRYPGIFFYIPSGAQDATLNGKVFPILVAAAPVEVGAPPVQTQPAPPAQPAPSVQAQPAPPSQPASPAPVTVVPAGPPPTAPPQSAPGSPAVIVPGQSIGAVRLGMKLADVTGLFGTSTEIVRSRDGTVTHWWLDASKRQGFGVRVASGRLDRLSIMNDATYMTDTGLHVGSTEPEIRGALGAPVAVNVDAQSQREILRYDNLGVWFEIQLDKQSPVYATVVAIDVVATHLP